MRTWHVRKNRWRRKWFWNRKGENGKGTCTSGQPFSSKDKAIRGAVHEALDSFFWTRYAVRNWLHHDRVLDITCPDVGAKILTVQQLKQAKEDWRKYARLFSDIGLLVIHD